MSWHKPYNISGTIQCGDRLDDICDIYREITKSDDVGLIGHFTGAISVYGQSPTVTFMTGGFDVHDAYFFVQGDRSNWLAFASKLGAALNRNAISHSLRVHAVTENQLAL